MGGVGMAFSGGGSRAAAFHLGALRALNELQLLARIDVLSGVSGGALMAALWAYHPGTFAEFDNDACELLRRGLQWDIARHAARPGPAARSLAGSLGNVVNPGRPRAIRTTNRTDALAAALSERAFGDRTLQQVEKPTEIVLTATDLITGGAVRLGSRMSSSSRLGRIDESWRIADAVAASAAFPALLPALERNLTFTSARDGRRKKAVLLADGGLYDNLGLSVLEPNRSAYYTDFAFDLDYLISCDAGRGPMEPKATHVWPSRMKRSLEILHERSENQGRGRLHDWRRNNEIAGFAMAYLGMIDERLPVEATGLVPRSEVISYPTDFKRMKQENLDKLTGRAEALMLRLVPYYCPELV